MGKPETFAQSYYESGADELLFMDVVASLYERNSLHDIIARVAKNIFIPLTVGGGLRTIDDIHKVLRSGADKVSLNTAAIQNIDFVKEAVQVFGASTIVIAIEAIKQDDGKFYAFTDNGREETGKEVIEWAKQVELLGVGEILITSVDREGTGEGYDLDLIESISEKVKIPVIAHGGAQKKKMSLSYFKRLLLEVLVLVLYYIITIFKKIMINQNTKTEGNVEFLKRQSKQFHKFKACNILDIKNQIYKPDLLVRKV